MQAGGSDHIHQGIAAVSQAAEKTGKASGNVLSSAEQLTKQAATLRADVDRFLGNIRAA